MDRSGLIETLSSALGVPAGEIKVERNSAHTNHVMHPEDRKLDTTEYVPASVSITIDEEHLMGRSLGGRVPENPLSPKPHWTTPPYRAGSQTLEFKLPTEGPPGAIGIQVGNTYIPFEGETR